jgi:hypothetical protein
MCGVPVVASPQQLDPVIEEFEVHGIRTDRIIIGGDETFLTDTMLNHVRCICTQRDIALDFLPNLIGLTDPPVPRHTIARPTAQEQHLATAVRPYFKIKRLIDFSLALLAILLLAPLFLLTHPIGTAGPRVARVVLATAHRTRPQELPCLQVSKRCGRPMISLASPSQNMNAALSSDDVCATRASTNFPNCSMCLSVTCR